MTAPVAAYSFDEPTGDAQDYSGNGHHFALNNGLARAGSGHTSGGLTKDGGAGTMGVVTATPFISASNWTVMCWQRNPGNAVWWVRLFNASENSGHGILNTGLLTARVREAGGVNRIVTTSPPAQDNIWRHYCMTFDGTFGRFYIDATLIGTTPAVGTPVPIDRIDIAEHTLTNFTMDDLRFFPVGITQPEIATWRTTPVVADPGSASRWRNGAGADLTPRLLTPSGLIDLT